MNTSKTMRSDLIEKYALEAIEALGESTKFDIVDYIINKLQQLRELPHFYPHERKNIHSLISVGFNMTDLKKSGFVSNRKEGQKWIWFINN
jgi:predicted transcriptional regulator|tara:strand:- start:83 stop:355 length:273 start_codon:yes stop_codon:yes gene_type:complete